MEITRGMFMIKDGGIATRNRPPYAPTVARGYVAPPNELAEIRARQERLQKAVDFVNGGGDGERDLSGDRIEWLMRMGYI